MKMFRERRVLHSLDIFFLRKSTNYILWNHPFRYICIEQLNNLFHMIEEKRRTTALMNLTRTLQLEDESLIDSNYQEQFKRLTAFIEDLINNNFDKLVHILYRIDVSENKLRSVLAKSSGSESSNLIAQLIIEREMEKIATREKYSKR